MTKALATWFSPSLNAKSRGKGASAVNSACYRACISLEDERTGLTHNYSRKRGHVETYLLDGEGFSSLNNNRESTKAKIAKLWNDVEASEKRKDARLARELIIPLPDDWTNEQNAALTKDLALHLRNEYGVAVQASIHDKNKKDRNRHAHVMFTTRVVDENNKLGAKTRVLDEGKTNGEIKKLRARICEIVNKHAELNKADWYVYAGKFNEIEGMEDHVSTKHIPINATPEKRKEMEFTNELIKEKVKTKKELKVSKQELANLKYELDKENLKLVVNSEKPKVNKKEEPKREIILIKDDWVNAHKRLETLTFAKLSAQKELEDIKLHGNEHFKNKPGIKTNLFGFETKASKQAMSDWSERMSLFKSSFREHKERINSYSAELDNVNLQANAQAYLRAIKHNRQVEAEREARIKREKELREQQERSFDEVSAESIEARMNAFNQSERHQTQQHYTTPTMGF